MQGVISVVKGVRGKVEEVEEEEEGKGVGWGEVGQCGLLTRSERQAWQV